MPWSRARQGSQHYGRASLLLPGKDERLPPTETGETGVAQWVLEEGQPAGRGTETLPANDAAYLPLTTPLRTRGLLKLERTAAQPLDPEQLGLLPAFRSLLALAIERAHFVEVALENQLRVEGEHLRNALLSAVSHDMRTPLVPWHPTR